MLITQEAFTFYMDPHNYLLPLLLILMGARIFAEVASRLQLPTVIGELMAGVILGPSLLGWVEPLEVLTLLAEIGIILLLFEVGLSTDITHLLDSGRQAIWVALSGFILPFIFGVWITHWGFGLSLLESLFIGGTLTATSIGITLRVLNDLHIGQSVEGQVVLGAAVIDDVLGVVLLAILYEFSLGGVINLGNASRVLGFIVLFFVVAPLAAKIISMVIKHFDATTTIRGLIPTTIVSLVLFFAWLANAIGAPEMLGGFAAGLALSRRFFIPLGIALHADPTFAKRISGQMRPIIALFTPIFFVVVGLSLNLREIDWSSSFIWSLSFFLLLVASFGKIAGAMLLGEPLARRWMIGFAMIPRGEVGLIFAELGRVSGILSNEIYAALLIVIALTTLLPPFIMKWHHQRYFAPIE